MSSDNTTPPDEATPSECAIPPEGARSSDNAPLVDLRGITRSFGDLQVLQPTDLTINHGDYLAVTGASGSGKSTLLNLVGLLDRPSTGSVWVKGERVDSLDDAHRSTIRGQTIGFVFQAFHLLPHRTATQNAELGMLYRSVNPHQRHQRAQSALTRVGLAHRLNAKPATMSGGERQRVAIARVLAAEADLLLADEPTGNLDTDTGELVLELFDKLNQTGMTLVVVTHNDAVAKRANRRLTMRDGTLTESP